MVAVGAAAAVAIGLCVGATHAPTKRVVRRHQSTTARGAAGRFGGNHCHTSARLPVASRLFDRARAGRTGVGEATPAGGAQERRTGDCFGPIAVDVCRRRGPLKTCQGPAENCRHAAPATGRFHGFGGLCR